jgi:hypothetical protein
MKHLAGERKNGNGQKPARKEGDCFSHNLLVMVFQSVDNAIFTPRQWKCNWGVALAIVSPVSSPKVTPDGQ